MSPSDRVSAARSSVSLDGIRADMTEPFRRYSRRERHEKIADGVFRVTYSNGAKMYVNYNDSPTVMDGMSIPAMDYVLSAGK